MNLIQHLNEKIDAEILSSKDVRSGENIRIGVRGLTNELCLKLIEAYKGRNNGFVVKGIKNYSVDSTEVLSENFISSDEATGYRNVNQSLLLFIPIGANLNKSLETSLSFIGLDEKTIIGSANFNDDPFITDLMHLVWEKLGHDFLDGYKKVFKISTEDRFHYGKLQNGTTGLTECWNLVDELICTDITIISL